MWEAFANAKATHIFSKNISYMPYLIISFNDTLTNDIVSFEQLGPGLQKLQIFRKSNTSFPGLHYIWDLQ